MKHRGHTNQSWLPSEAGHQSNNAWLDPTRTTDGGSRCSSAAGIKPYHTPLTSTSKKKVGTWHTVFRGTWASNEPTLFSSDIIAKIASDSSIVQKLFGHQVRLTSGSYGSKQVLFLLLQEICLSGISSYPCSTLKIQQLSLKRATADRCNCRQTCASTG